MNISVMIPSFNEEKNLIKLIPELKKHLALTGAEYEITVIDAMASSDDSIAVCNRLNVNYIRQTKKGYGDAFRTGIQNARSCVFLVVDADNCQDITKIPEMYKRIQSGADVVIGSRYVKGGKTADPPINILMSRILNTAYSIALGIKQKDISTDFRMYRTSLLKKITTRCENFDVIEETLFLLQKADKNIKIEEVPISYSKRTQGSSKRRLFTFIKDYIVLLVRLIKIKKRG